MDELTSKNKNTNISNVDVNEYLNELDNFYIDYLYNLGINHNYTYGIEVEYRDIYEYITGSFVEKNLISWSSLFEPNIPIGGEVVSPVLTDRKKTWKDIRSLCKFLRDEKAGLDVGGHIHIGMQIFDNDIDMFKKFLYLYTSYEEIIYRFANGEFINARQSQLNFAGPFAIELSHLYDYIKESDLNNLSLYLKKFERFNGLNFRNIKWDNFSVESEKNTIEFRMPNGTFSEEVWQNNIYFFIKLIEASKKDLDMDLLDYKIKEKQAKLNYSDYYKINIEDALLLADTVYDNNYDKAKFIKQYYKDGSEVKNKKKMVLSKKKIIKDKI